MNIATAVDDRPHRRKLDIDDYRRMAEVGILSADERVELIDGEIIAMSPIGGPHSNLVIWLTGVLNGALSGRALVSVQNPLRLPDHSVPQPDIALVRPQKDLHKDKEVRQASDALLVIEVADTSLSHDRDTKIPLYGAHGIPEAWLIDIGSARLTRYRDPGSAGYADIDVPERSVPLSIAALPSVGIDLSDLF